jgi:hypothetical protein
LTRLQERARLTDWELEIENWELTFKHLVFRFRQGQIQAIIDWLRTCRRVFLGGSQETLSDGER